MATTPQNAAPRKKIIRRMAPDRFQQVRHTVQYVFVALNLWLGLQFFLWVRFYEHGGQGLSVARPAGAEGWLPIAGLMNFKLFLSTGVVPSVHPAAMFLFMAFCAMSLIAKKSFCSWLCPVGTLSEHLALVGRKLLGRNFRLPRWTDIPLRGLKYFLLAFFMVIIGGMSAEMLANFLDTPYGLLADVKMLNFFRHMSGTALVVVSLLVLLSVVVEGVWCRYLCPYGALMGLLSLLSPLKIRREASLCSDCGHCAKVCPAALAVDKLVQIRSVECTACMACVATCPAEGALRFSIAGKQTAKMPRWRRAVTPAGFVVLLGCLFFGFVLVARATNHWQTPIPPEVYQRLIPEADQLGHPGMN
jgi:polyferredoxin